MPTALQMITRSLRLNGDFGIGQAVSAEDGADALYALNEMMESFNNQRLMIYQVLVEEFPLVVGTSSYTIGTSADFDTDRPVALENTNFLRSGQLDYPLRLINQAAYAAIPDKFTQQLPSFIYYDPAFPDATIYFDTEPDQAYTLHLASRKILQQFASLTTSLSLPPGYQGAIEYTLAERLAPEYGHEAPPSVKQQAANYRRWLKTINAPNGILGTETGIMTQNGVWNIFQG